MPSDVNLNIDVSKGGKGDEEAAVGLEAVAKAADNAKDQLSQLDRKLLETRAAMVAAGKTFNETGDISPLRALLKDERQLSTVQKSISRGAGAIAADLAQAGEQGGERFIARFATSASNALTSLPAPEGLKQWLVAGAVVASPAIGAAISAGILLGVGGVGIAAGLAGAAQDSRVRAAYADLGSFAKQQLAEAGSGFVGPALASADQLKRALTTIGPELKGDFDAVAPSLNNLVDGLTGFIEKMQSHGLGDAFQAARPVIDALAQELPNMGAAMGDFFHDIAAGGPGAVQFIHDFSTGLNLTVESTGKVIEALSKTYDFLRNNPLGQFFTGPISALFDKVEQGGQKAQKSLAEYNAEGYRAANATRDANAAFQATQLAAYNAANSIQALSAKYDSYINKTLGADQASLAAQQAFNDLRDAVAQNGRALDDHSAKGIRNEQVILNSVGAFERQRQAAIDAAGGQNASASAVAAANAKYDAQVSQLEDLSGQLGLSRGDVDKLIGDMRSIPNIERTITINQVVKTAHIDTSFQMSPGGASPYMQSASALLGAGALGGIRAYAAGGIDQMAGFLKATNPGTLLAAEPRTGGEALIPRLGISDQRGLDLANVAASWHGGRVVSGRGRYGGAPMASVGGGTNVTVKMEVQATAGSSSMEQAMASWIMYAVRTGMIQLTTDSGGRVRVG